MATRELRVDDIDLARMAFWEQSAEERDAASAVLRRECPVARFGPADSVLMPPGPDTPGFWALTRHADVRRVSRNPELFCSGQGVHLDDFPPEFLEALVSFLGMDAPEHTRLRGLVQKGFTPRHMKRIVDTIADQARGVVDEFPETGEGDFVELVSSRLPMKTINAFLGVPPADQARLAHYTDELVGWNDPDVVGDRTPQEMFVSNLSAIHEAANELADLREREPQDDLLTTLVHAEVDGRKLTRPEIGAFLVLFTTGGNDTSRHTTSGAAAALWRDHPDQRRILQEDVAGLEVAVEEFLRWTTSLLTMARRATQDTEIAGTPIAAGDRVVMIYPSANRDESVFDEPYAFNVRREPNPHVALGGGGPHFCPGNALARTQLRCIFGELLTRVKDMELGESEYLVGNLIAGIQRMPVRVKAA